MVKRAFCQGSGVEEPWIMRWRMAGTIRVPVSVSMLGGYGDGDEGVP